MNVVWLAGGFFFFLFFIIRYDMDWMDFFTLSWNIYLPYLSCKTVSCGATNLHSLLSLRVFFFFFQVRFSFVVGLDLMK